MSIQSSLYAGVSGLNTNSNAMNVIGNNIANTNTTGFKSSRTVFSDLLSSFVAGSGGTSQVGRGVGLSTVDNLFSQGTFETTESNTDLAIEGAGFFMLRDPNGADLAYSRAGSFHFDDSGQLINPEGYIAQGYMLDIDGNPAGDVGNIQVNTTSFTPASQTGTIDVVTNLDSTSDYLGGFSINDPTATSNYTTSVQVYDSLGETHLLTTYFARRDPATDPNTWDVYTVVDTSQLDSANTYYSTDAFGDFSTNTTVIASGTLSFQPDGTLAAPVALTTSITTLASAGPPPVFNAPISDIPWGNGADQTQTIEETLNCTQFASDSVVTFQDQNGYGAGTLSKLEINNNGIITGYYSNSQSRELAQIVLASFSNPGGLQKGGANLFVESNASGPPMVATVGTGGGKLYTNSLEQSNVDLAQEFVKMIQMQRGFQANSKIITTVDEMMSDLINLKR